jgi:hypothetical protein
MDIVYMASSINQSNPLSAKFFIFFSEMLLALRLSDGSVLPPDSWSLPPTTAASPSPPVTAFDSLPRSGCVSMSEPCSGTGPVKIVSIVGASDASAFLRSVLLGDYPVVRADSDNESCKEEDEDNEKCENESNGTGDKDDDVDDVDNDDDDDDDDDDDNEKENAVPCSAFDNGGTLIDARSAEGGDHEYDEGRNEGAKGDGDREEDEEEEEEDEMDDAASNAHGSSKRGNPTSDEKNSAKVEGDTAESNSGRKMPSMKTISPHTSSRCLHSPPLKINESLRFLSVQKSSSAVWSQHAGLYALMSLVHLYFTCCASEWSVRCARPCKLLLRRKRGTRDQVTSMT